MRYICIFHSKYGLIVIDYTNQSIYCMHDKVQFLRKKFIFCMNPMTYYSNKIFMKQRFDISNVLENNIIMKIFDFIDFFKK